jgi:hypothetical protein
MLSKKFLIDSNVFIQAKDMYYRFDFCSGFWAWVKTAHAAGHVYSCKKVLSELAAGPPNDPAHTWATSLPPGFFIEDTKDASVMTHYQPARAVLQSDDFG